MQEKTRFVDWFRASAPYIHAHRGRTFVVHIDGAAVAAGNFAGVVHDLALMRSLGVRLVVVHGARQQIERSLEQRGFSVRYAQGLRVTEMPALGTVLEAVGATRIAIESLLSMGVANSPMAGAAVRVAGGNFITARPIGVHDGVDFGFSGEVRRIDTDAIAARLAADEVVLLSPIGHSPTGETFNLRSEDLAAAVAIELRAAKLLFLAPDARLVDAEGHPARQLSLADARALQRSLRGDQHATDRVVLERAVHACLNGVGRTHVLDANIDGALLMELFTRDGLGSMVTLEPYDQLRRATIDDVGGVLTLIEPLERDGVLVRRSREKLEADVDHFLVLERDGAVIACAATYPFAEDGVVELACLAVDDAYRDGSRGDRLLDAVEREAAAAGADRVFVLTTHATHWFKERGFVDASLDSLPVERRQLYNYQRNSKVLTKQL